MASNQGRQRNNGIQERKIQVIKGIHDLGVPIDRIAKASKLRREEVEHILKRIV